MVIYNAATRELTAKIVYYGPGLCGKTTNLKVLHDRLEPGTAGKLLNLQTQTDRTIYFDLLPVELGDIKGYKIRFQLATVPGQTAFNETRRVVLKGVDGIVFVADSQWTMLPKNLEAWQNLKDNLKVNAITFESIPVVVQYNKRDLADILAVDAMQEALGLSSYPFVEAVASAGRGVTETFKLISKLTFVDLLRRLQGRRAEEESAARAAADAAREDDLQTWKDSLLKRESQPAVPRPSRPLSLVPRGQDEAPFDTTELGKGVDDDEPASPYSVPAPPEMRAPAEPGGPLSPAATVQMEAVSAEIDMPDGTEAAPPVGNAPREDEAPEILSEADEVEIDIPGAPSPAPPEDPPTSRPSWPPRRRTTRVSTCSNSACGTPTPGPAGSGRRPNAWRRRSPESRIASPRRASTSPPSPNVCRRSNGASAGSTRPSRLRSSACRRSRPRRADPPTSKSGLRRLESALAELDERLRGEMGRQRKDADDVGMALRGLTERAQAVERELAGAIGRLAGHDDRLVAVAELAERILPIEARAVGAAPLLGEAAGPRDAGRDRPARPPRPRVVLRGEDPARAPRGGGHPLADRAAAGGPRPPARVRRDALFRDGTPARDLRRVAPRPRRARPQQPPKVTAGA